MTGTALGAVQEAIFTTLDAAGITDLTATAVPVCDFIEDNQAYPYIQVGDDEEIPFDHLGPRFGKEVETDIHIFSQYKGHKEAKHIADQVIVALDCVALSVPGFVHHYTNHENTFSIVEDEDTRHVIIRFLTRVTR